MNRKVSIISIITAVFLSSCGTYMEGTRDEALIQLSNPDLVDPNIVEIHKLKDNIAKKDKEITTLRWNYMQQLQSKEEEITKKKEEIKKLTLEHNKKIAVLKTTLLLKKKNIEQLTTIKQNLEAELETKKKDISDLNKSHKEEIKILQQKIIQTELDKEKAIKELQENFERQKQDLETDFKGKEQILKTEIQDKNREITELKQKFENTKTKLENTKADLIAEQKRITKLQTDLIEALDKSMKYYEEIKKRDKKIKELETQLAQTTQELNLQIENLRKEKQNLQTQINTITQQKNQLQTTLESKIKEFNSIKKILEDQKAVLQNQLNNMIQERDNYKNQYNNTKVELDRVKQELQTTLANVRQKTQEIQEKDNKIQLLNIELESIKKQLTKPNHLETLTDLASDYYCGVLYCFDSYQHIITTSYIEQFKVNPSSNSKTIYRGNVLGYSRDRDEVNGDFSIDIMDNTGIGNAELSINEYKDLPVAPGVKESSTLTALYENIDFKGKGFYKQGAKITQITCDDDSGCHIYKSNDPNATIKGFLLGYKNKNEVIGEASVKEYDVIFGGRFADKN